MTHDDRLNQENWAVLYAVQAFAGLISRNMIAIFLDTSPDNITVHFALREITADTEEEIEDMLLELDAQYDMDAPALSAEVHVGPPGEDWKEKRYRVVYWAKE
ncbi:hypothetical protein ACFV4N_08330 [Actinosynnema sp. NPDC059797]